MELNTQLERVVKGGPKKYIDAGSVSKNLNNIKSSLDQAIRDLTVHSVSRSLGTAGVLTVHFIGKCCCRDCLFTGKINGTR